MKGIGGFACLTLRLLPLPNRRLPVSHLRCSMSRFIECSAWSPLGNQDQYNAGLLSSPAGLDLKLAKTALKDSLK